MAIRVRRYFLNTIMRHQIKNYQKGFMALMGVMFLGAIFSIVLFIRVQRLAALRDQFLEAKNYVLSDTEMFSCQAVQQLTQTADPLYSPQHNSLVDLPFYTLDVGNSALRIVATSCVP